MWIPIFVRMTVLCAFVGLAITRQKEESATGETPVPRNGLSHSLSFFAFFESFVFILFLFFSATSLRSLELCGDKEDRYGMPVCVGMTAC